VRFLIETFWHFVRELFGSAQNRAESLSGGTAIPRGTTVPKVEVPKAAEQGPVDSPNTAALQPRTDWIPDSESKLSQIKQCDQSSAVGGSVKPRTSGGPVPLIIGLDFGTHSTKVVVRRRNEQVGNVVVLDLPCQGYPRFASPSAVRIDNGKLFFGTSAVLHHSGTLGRLLKLELLKDEGGLPTQSSSPDFLVAAYLLWVLKTVGKWIDNRYGAGNVRPFLNVPAPMDHFGKVALKGRYLQIVQLAWCAWRSGIRIQSGSASEDLRHLFEATLAGIPEPSVRPYDVLPETIAPIVSLSQDPRMTPGMYQIVDMGAGTTELSINYVPPNNRDGEVLCYFDQSITLGAEALVGGSCPAELLSQLWSANWKTWSYGYQKDALNYAARERWGEVTVLLAGGGTCRADVKTELKREHPIFNFRPSAKYRQLRHTPANLLLEDGTASEQELSLAAVANGLAFPRQQWPKFCEPTEIGPTPPTRERENPSDPFWYVNG
jgi:hypothetical protein